MLPRRVAVFYLASVACGCTNDPPFPNSDELSAIQTLQSIEQPPRQPTNKYADNDAAAQLGSQLFSDSSFSPCGLTCAGCHPPPSYTLPFAVGRGCNGNTDRNVISLLNVVFSDWHYWDGRKDSVWAHPTIPLLDPAEMASTPALVRQQLSANYGSQYQSVFGVLPSDETDDNRLLANFGKAIEAFMRHSLIHVDAPFDTNIAHFISSVNNGKAQDDPFYEPLRVFIRKGNCVFCHKGPLLSDGSFHNIGVGQSPPTDHGHLDGIALLNVDVLNGAGNYSDDPMSGATKLSTLAGLTTADLDGAFRTPSLRNVALTAPYMHTGEYTTLSDVVDFYNRGGDPIGEFPGTRATTVHPLNLSSSEKAALVTLLNSLTAKQ